MPIITISCDSHSHGAKIAKNVSEIMAYTCIGPEVIKHACERMDLSSDNLHEALLDSPTLLERISVRKERYLALFRAAFFRYMCQDNVVYHGQAGHIFLADVPSVVKVRVLAAFNDRIQEEMQHGEIRLEGAKKRLISDDRNRARATRQLYGKDDNDPKLYDLYLNLGNIDIDAATAIIVSTTRVSTNGHDDLMRKKLADMSLAAETEARLLNLFSEVEVVARDGEVFVSILGSILQQEVIVEKAQRIISDIQGVRIARVGVAPSNYVPF